MQSAQIIILTVFIVICSAQVTKFGKCPQYKTQQGFEPAKYFTGRFYEQKRFWTVFEMGAKCVHADYSLLADGKVRVENSGFNSNGRFSQVGNAYCETNATANCHVRFYEGTPYGGYNVLATDYDNYGLVYSCREVLGGAGNLQFAWILTRSKTVSAEEMKKYLAVFETNGIDVTQFNDVAQDCLDN